MNGEQITIWEEETVSLSDDIYDNLPLPDYNSEDIEVRTEILSGHEGGTQTQTRVAESTTAGDCVTGPQQRNEVISFVVGSGFQRDSDLAEIYPQDAALVFATMARDLQVVKNHHLAIINSLGGNYESLTFSPPAALRRTAYSICHSIGDVIRDLAATEQFMGHNLEMYAGRCSPPKRMVPGNDEKPWVRWPYNRYRVFLTKLLSRYMGIKQNMKLQYTEITDYCVAQNKMLDPREPIFHDEGCALVLRRQMNTMEQGCHLCPSIITAWARIYNREAKPRHSPDRACLSLVDRGDVIGRQDEDIVEDWITWLVTCEMDIKSSKMIMIPVRMRNHYTLLEVNFTTQKFQSIDSAHHSDQECWDVVATSIGLHFGNLMERIGDSRVAEFRSFNYKLFNPHWCIPVRDPDSGIKVMHLIDVYSGRPSDMRSINLEKEHVCVRLKIKYISLIVLNSLNVFRTRVLASIPRFIEDKCNDVLSPTVEVQRYRETYGWLQKP